MPPGYCPPNALSREFLTQYTHSRAKMVVDMYWVLAD